MNLIKMFKSCFKDGSIGIITLYNGILSIIDIIVLILSIVLLSSNHGIGIIVGTLLLVFAAIAVPCLCCGVCYIWSLFHIQNHLKLARFMGICNFVMMLFTFIIIATNVEEEKPLENPGVAAFFMILNVLGLVSVIFLCTINCGFEEEVEITEVPQRALPAPITMEQCMYPSKLSNNTSIRQVIEYPEPEINDRVELQIVENNNPQHIVYIERPSAPALSPSLSLEGKPTMR